MDIDQTIKRLKSIRCTMRTRCYNKKHWSYEYYGARGIVICDEWLNSFGSFYQWAIVNGYANDLTIDRKDNDSSYFPENCRWVTMKQQCVNRRTRHDAFFLENKGVNKSFIEWCTQFSIPYSVAINRYNSGWEFDKIFNNPIREYLNSIPIHFEIDEGMLRQMKKQKYELKEYLNALCITQREAALSIGCSERQIRRVMNGESPAGYKLRKLIAIWAGDKIDLAKLAMIEPKK